MFPFTEITPLLAEALAAVFTEKDLLNLFLLVIAIVALQYYRIGKAKEKFFGLKPRGIWRDVLLSVGLGLLGGILASYLMIFVGLSLSGSGLMYLWPLAILLMLIDVRFMCFAYAGGILALSSLLFGWPELQVPQILGLVAVLHMVEAFLILVSGHLGAVPTYFKNAEGKVVGGFLLQKFWPIPMAVLMLVGHTNGPSGLLGMSDWLDLLRQGKSTFNTQDVLFIVPGDWWPLIKENLGRFENAIYTLMPVIAGLGYGDLAAARTPRQKGRISAVILGLYSLLLLALAVWADRLAIFAFVAALFAPLGHELVIYLGKRMEMGKPIYQACKQGVKVLDVIPGYPAWQAGIRSGDIIVEVNGMSVNSRQGLEFALGIYKDLQITYYSQSERQIIREGLEIKEQEMLGLLPVPEGNEGNYMELSTQGPLNRWLSNRRQKNGQ